MIILSSSAKVAVFLLRNSEGSDYSKRLLVFHPWNTLFSIALNILLGLLSLFRELVTSSSWDLPWISAVSFGTISWIIGISAILHYFGSFFVNLTVTIRRLRDAGKNWVWVLIPLWNLYLCTKPTKQIVTTNFSN